MNILIIGSSGFLGTSLIKSLDYKYKITCFDKIKSPKYLKSKNNITNFFLADAGSKKKIKQAIKNIDVIYYRAGVTGGPKSIDLKYFEKYMKINFENLIKILDLVKNSKVKKFIFDSTEQIYGEFDKKKSDEFNEPNPYNYYGLSKVIAEKYLFEWQKKNKISVDIFRYSRVMVHDTPGVIEEMVKNALFKKKIEIYGNPQHKISFVHINDVISANIKALRKFKKCISIYNIIGTKPISLKELSQMISKLILKNKNIKIIYKKYNNFFEPSIVSMNSKKTKKDLKWKPKFTIEDIINEKIKYIKR